jgi:hypothetical protein
MYSRAEPIALTIFMKPEREVEPLKLVRRAGLKDRSRFSECGLSLKSPPATQPFNDIGFSPPGGKPNSLRTPLRNAP